MALVSMGLGLWRRILQRPLTFQIGHNMKRRKFLKIVGGLGFIASASVTTGLYALGKGPAANSPWHIAGSDYQDPRLRALSWAILAPNPHNIQPWLIELNDDLTMTLSIDENKRLPHTDPFNRQILIGIGCFCELLTIAAAQDNYKTEFDWFPQGINHEDIALDKRPIAKIKLSQGAQSDSLLSQVLQRRSYKQPFDNAKEISAEVLTQLASVQRPGASVHTNNNSSFVDLMRQETMQAMSVEMTTERVYMESARLMRIGTDEIKANPDGISLKGHHMMALREIGVVTKESLMDMTSDVYKQGIEGVVETLASTKGYMWVTTQGNSRMEQIEAGRNYLRLNLQATKLGLHMHPVSQGLQEYGEMKTIYKNIHDIVGVSEPGRVQMLTRLGYGADIEASPRWPVTNCIS